MTSLIISEETAGLGERSSVEERARLEHYFTQFIRDQTNGTHLRDFIYDLVNRVQHFLMTSPNFTAGNSIYSALSSETSNLSIIEYEMRNMHINYDELTVNARLQRLRLYLFQNKFIICELIRFFDNSSIQRPQLLLNTGSYIQPIFESFSHLEIIREIRELKEINLAQNQILLAQQELLEKMQTYVENLPEKLKELKSLVKELI